jgi:hypothetical protein
MNWSNVPMLNVYNLLVALSYDNFVPRRDSLGYDEYDAHHTSASSPAPASIVTSFPGTT